MSTALPSSTPAAGLETAGARPAASPVLHAPYEAVPELLREELLHELFEHQALARPGQMALACGDDRMAYRELDDRATQLGRFLRARGIGRGKLVGLLLPRSMDVYVGLLGILKAGAGYVPMDPDYPGDRVQYILSDSNAAAVVTVKAMAEKLGPLAERAIFLDEAWREIAQQPVGALKRAETEVTPGDIAYVIYTSGSTGRPKGVAVEHRSVCHLVRAEGRIFGVQPSDRVYQGFSIAFDASVEEVWLAFFGGATLVVGTREMVFSGPGLSRHLSEAGVTVFSTVPTQLAMMTDDVPGLRILIVGGEACQADLVRRWAKPGRRMVNTYGPTEATVIATWGELLPGQPVTIGRPIPNCFICLLDEKLQPVASGEKGELCIGGVALARGYVGRDDLTAEKFIANPMGGEPGRLYRTGDLTRLTAAGELEFHGRIDSQVKLRGYRIELSEIESVMLEAPGVRAAAATVREDVPGIQQLVGYVVAKDGSLPAEAELKNILRQRLAPYMVPAMIETIEELPRLPSGKVDRRALPAPRRREAEAQADYVGPRDAVETKLAAIWEKLFAPQKISVRANFFHDLGGHSLLAARLASELRREPGFEQVSILDIYQSPSIEAMAEKLRSAAGRAEQPREQKAQPARSAAEVQADARRHFWCGCAQFLSLYVILAIFSLQWLAPYLTYSYVYEWGYSRWEAVVAAFGVLVVLYPVFILLAVAVKWVVIGRYRPGRHKLWGAYYFRFWFVNAIQSSVPVGYLSSTPLLNWFYRLMGARIGKDAHFSTPCFVCHDLVEVGDRACIGAEASLTGYHVEDGHLVIGAVKVGKDCYVGTRTVVREGTVIEDGAMLEDLSLLGKGRRIPAGERWRGSPARACPGEPPPDLAHAPLPGLAKRFAMGLLYFLGVGLFPACVLSAILPGVMLLNYFAEAGCGLWIIAAAPIVGLSYVVLLCVEMAAIKWLLLGRVQAGRHPVASFYQVRRWFVDQLLGLSLDVLGPLYASIYLAPWYRMLGAKLGPRAEVSTASFISPDLLELGAESFIADSVSLGCGRVERGYVTLGINKIGQRSFVGNSAFLPGGAVLGDDALIGCLSTTPPRIAEAARAGTTWLGSPAMELPTRQTSTAFAVETTFRPTRKLQAQRAAIEFFRVILPVTGFVTLTILLFEVMARVSPDNDVVTLALVLPLFYGACGLLTVALVVAAKWLMVGKYQAGERPLWSTFVWRNELVNALHEHLASDYLVNLLPGTPFVCWYFRLLGTRIGKRVYLDTTDITEHDLVSIGDEAEINADATLQTHLFEDRVMKMSRVDLGARANVGSVSLVLYDTQMEDGARLNDLSLLMKGETLPAGTLWEGVPARPAVKD